MSQNEIRKKNRRNRKQAHKHSSHTHTHPQNISEQTLQWNSTRINSKHACKTHQPSRFPLLCSSSTSSTSCSLYCFCFCFLCFLDSGVVAQVAVTTTLPMLDCQLSGRNVCRANVWVRKPTSDEGHTAHVSHHNHHRTVAAFS